MMAYNRFTTGNCCGCDNDESQPCGGICSDNNCLCPLTPQILYQGPYNETRLNEILSMDFRSDPSRTLMRFTPFDEVVLPDNNSRNYLIKKGLNCLNNDRYEFYFPRSQRYSTTSDYPMGLYILMPCSVYPASSGSSTVQEGVFYFGIGADVIYKSMDAKPPFSPVTSMHNEHLLPSDFNNMWISDSCEYLLPPAPYTHYPGILSPRHYNDTYVYNYRGYFDGRCGKIVAGLKNRNYHVEPISNHVNLLWITGIGFPTFGSRCLIPFVYEELFTINSYNGKIITDFNSFKYGLPDDILEDPRIIKLKHNLVPCMEIIIYTATYCLDTTNLIRNDPNTWQCPAEIHCPEIDWQGNYSNNSSSQGGSGQSTHFTTHITRWTSENDDTPILTGSYIQYINGEPTFAAPWQSLNHEIYVPSMSYDLIPSGSLASWRFNNFNEYWSWVENPFRYDGYMGADEWSISDSWNFEGTSPLFTVDKVAGYPVFLS